MSRNSESSPLPTRRTRPARGAAPAAASGRHAVDERLAFIEARLVWEGRVNRGDLVRRFGVSETQATADFGRYRRLAPRNLLYDLRSRAYLPGRRFRPVFGDPDSGALMLQLFLAASAGGLVPDGLAALPAMETVPRPERTLDAAVVVPLQRALRRAEALQVTYQSLGTPHPVTRWIEPHALVHDGERWHVRAWDRVRSRFGDFAVARILEVHATGPRSVDPATDGDWHTAVPVALEPHPGFSPSQRAVVRADWGFPAEPAPMVVSVRRATLLYFVRALDLRANGRAAPARESPLVLCDEAGMADTFAALGLRLEVWRGEPDGS